MGQSVDAKVAYGFAVNTDVLSVYPDLVLQLRSLSDRSCNAAADIIEQLAAERDRLADENRALREAIRTHEDLHRPVGPDSPNGPIHMDGWPCCDDDRHLWAAADRGVTDGEATDG
jgi:hypothetical protein